MIISKHIFWLLLFTISIIAASCLDENNVLLDDPLNGAVVKEWDIPPESFINHPEYGRVYQLKGDSTWLNNQAPSIGAGKWGNCRVEFEMMLTEEKGFVGLDFNLQENPDFGCNFHLATFRDTIPLQSMGLWGTKKGSWKLWPVSQKVIFQPHDRWLHFAVEYAKSIANIYLDGECIYTIYDLPYSSGGIRFFTSYGGTAFFRNLVVTKIEEDQMEPVLPDYWAEARKLNTIRNWSITELKPNTYANTASFKDVDLDKEKWREVTTDARGVLNIGAIYPHYKENTILAKTVMNATQATTITCYMTYTDRFRLFCNGQEVFHGPDRNWWNPDREKHGNSRLIPNQYQVALQLKKGKNEIIVRSEVMENFGWGFWMRTE